MNENEIRQNVYFFQITEITKERLSYTSTNNPIPGKIYNRKSRTNKNKRTDNVTEIANQWELSWINDRLPKYSEKKESEKKKIVNST